MRTRISSVITFWKRVWIEVVAKAFASMPLKLSTVLKSFLGAIFILVGTYLLLGIDEFRKNTILLLLGILGPIVWFFFILIVNLIEIPSSAHLFPSTPTALSRWKLVLASMLVFSVMLIQCCLSYQGASIIAQGMLHKTATIVASAVPSSTTTLTPTHTTTPSPTPSATLTSTITPTVTNTRIPHYPGLDFEDGCIDKSNWIASNGVRFTTDAIGCLRMSNWGISARSFPWSSTLGTPSPQQRGLVIDHVNSLSQEVSRGIFIHLPGSNRSQLTIRFSVLIDALSGDALTANPNLAFGIGNKEETLDRGHFLFFRVTANSPDIYAFSGESLYSPGYCPFYNSRDCIYTRPSEIVFEVDGTNVELQINQVIQRRFVLYSREDLVFWIGYRLPHNGHIRAFIWNFRVE